MSGLRHVKVLESVIRQAHYADGKAIPITTDLTHSEQALGL